MSLWAYKPSIGVCSMLLSLFILCREEKYLLGKYFHPCVFFVAEDGQPWAGDVAWEMRTLLPPVQTSISVFSWIFIVQYSEFSIAHLITFAISTSLAAAAS